MQLTIPQSNLRRALSRVLHAHSPRPALPILASVLLSATPPSQVVLRSTDLSLGIEMHLEGAQVEQEGEAAILSRPFSAWVASQEATTLLLFGTSAQVVGQAGRHRASFHTLSAADYPAVIPQVQMQAVLLLETTRLREMLALVVPAAAEERQESTAIFTGVLVQVQGQSMRLVASDRTLLATGETLLPRTSHESSLLLPATSLAKLARVLPLHGMVEVLLARQGNQAVFRSREMAVSITLLAGNYPAYSQVIPPKQERVTRVLIERPDLKRALDQVRPFARLAGERAIRIQVDPAGEVRFSVHAEEGAVVSVCLAQVSGPAQEIGLEGTYLDLMVSRLLGAHLLLEITSPHRPVLLRVAGTGAETKDTFVLMPLLATENPPSAHRTQEVG